MRRTLHPRILRYLAWGVSVLVGLAVYVEAHRYLKRKEFALGKPAYLEARRDLPQGYPVQLVDFRPVWREETTEKWVTDQEWDLLVRRSLVCALSKGALLEHRCVGEASAKPTRKKQLKRRAIPVWSEIEGGR